MLQFSKTKMKGHIFKYILFIPEIITTILTFLKAVKVYHMYNMK